MSTHNLDVSGARPLTSTVNDPASTRASTSAKAGDDVAVTLGGLREIRTVLPPGAKIERRLYVRKTARKDPETNVVMKDDDGEYLWDETPYEELVLVVVGTGLNVFGRASKDPRDEGSEAPYEGTPHTSLSARRWPDLHMSESGELVGEETVEDLVDQPEGIPSSLI